MPDHTSTKASRSEMHVPPLAERGGTGTATADAAAIGAGVFLACSPVPFLRRAVARRVALWLRLDPLKVLLGCRSVPLVVTPFLLLAEWQLGVWLRRGETHALTLEGMRGIDPTRIVPDLLLGWIVAGLVAAFLAFITTLGAVNDSSADPWFGALIRKAAERYLGGSITGWEFARAKPRLDPVFEEVFLRALPRSGGTLIDVGCGQGVMLALLVEGMSAATRPDAAEDGATPPRFARLVGIETRPRVAQMAASALGDRATIVQGDARGVRFEPCSAALLFDVLQMMSQGQQETLLADLRAVLDPQGVILIREADASAGWRFQRVRIGNRLKVLAGGALRQQFSFRTREEWLACFRRLGFAAELLPLRDQSSSGNVLFRLTAIENASS